MFFNHHHNPIPISFPHYTQYTILKLLPTTSKYIFRLFCRLRGYSTVEKGTSNLVGKRFINFKNVNNETWGWYFSVQCFIFKFIFVFCMVCLLYTATFSSFVLCLLLISAVSVGRLNTNYEIQDVVQLFVKIQNIYMKNHHLQHQHYHQHYHHHYHHHEDHLINNKNVLWRIFIFDLVVSASPRRVASSVDNIINITFVFQSKSTKTM